MKDSSHLEPVFAVYDAHRRERTQWLVRSSRRAGNLYEFLTQDVGRDVAATEKELAERLSHVWNYDIEDVVREGVKDLHRRLSVPGAPRSDSQSMPFYTNDQNGVETQ